MKLESENGDISFPSKKPRIERERSFQIQKPLPSPSCPFFGSVLDKEISYKVQIYLQMVDTHLVQNFSTKPSNRIGRKEHISHYE